MKILLLRSERTAHEGHPPDPYSQEFRSAFAERVIANLRSEPGQCSVCGPDCIACRRDYDRRFGAHIAGIVAFPSRLPFLIERPADLLPPRLPAHDVLLAINIHEQIFLALLERAHLAGARAAIVPLESRDWFSRGAQEEAQRVAAKIGMELAFPKPFCAFDPPRGSLLDMFRRTFHIGKPEVRLEISEGRIVRAHVETSAACGATYYVARWLVGRRTDEDLRHDVVARRLHSYPCTASMAWDEDLGDTVMHVSSEAHCAILDPLGHRPPDRMESVLTPLGRSIPRPRTPQENLRLVQQARDALLADLDAQGTVSLTAFRRSHRFPPAAAHTAILLLKKEGIVARDGDSITLVRPLPPPAPLAGHDNSK